MGLVSVGHFDYPNTPRGLFDLNTTPSTSTMNSAVDNIAWVVQVTQAGTIDKIHWRPSTIAANTVRVSFQELDSVGRPDGTDVEWRDLVLAGTEDNTIVETGLITDDGTDTGVKRTVAAGDRFAVVFSLPGWTTGNMAFAYLLSDSDQYRASQQLFANTPPTFTYIFADICGAIEYDDATFPFFPNMAAFETATNHTLDDADTPDEYALKIEVPFACRAAGVWLKGASGATNPTTITLYSAGGSTLATMEADDKSFAANAQTKIHHYTFDTPIELTASTVYRISWKPPASPTTKIFWTYSFPDAAMRGCQDNGLNMALSTRVDSGSWSDSTTELVPGGFIIDQVDDGAGGGGGSCALTNGTAVIPATCPV